MSNHGDTGANGAEAIQQADSGANLNVNDGNDAALPALAAPARQELAALALAAPARQALAASALQLHPAQYIYQRNNSILLNIFD